MEAGKLLPQERLKGIDGQEYRLTSIVPRAGPETVYNLEVAIDHVYYVGQNGLLAHNMCAKAADDAAKKIDDVEPDGALAKSVRKKKKHKLDKPKKVLSSPNPVRKVIREAYEDIQLGRGTPRLNPDGTQKVFQARELKRISGSNRNRWENALEFEVPGTNHRILKRSDGVLGYVENHDYSRIKVFPKPWYPDGY